MAAIRIAFDLRNQSGISALKNIEATLATLDAKASHLCGSVWQLNSNVWGQALTLQLEQLCLANDFFLVRRSDTGEELIKSGMPPGTLESLRTEIEAAA